MLPRRNRLAAAMVGRTRTGVPLADIQEQAIPGVGPSAEQIRLNQFTFDGDRDGARCPFGAHVRRANPRTERLSGWRDRPLTPACRAGIPPHPFPRRFDFVRSLSPHPAARS